MKKIMLTAITLGVIASVFVYFTIPFTSAKENEFHQPLSTSSYYTEKLNTELKKQLEQGEQDALVVLKGQKLLSGIGKTEDISNVASVRKSLISALFGIAESKGLVNLQDTLEDLDIDDKKNPLTMKEKQATVEDLLKSRSGIYISSIGESQSMKEERPEREEYSADEYFYYNNWDFNTLGVIFEQETKLTLGEAFYEWIAKPTEMKMFQPKNVVYEDSVETAMPMYRFYMSTEDLARFGSLYANSGQWKGKQIIPQQWIDQSFTSYSEVQDVYKFTGYGYLWWLDYNEDNQLQWAVGSGGQFILIDRENNLTIATMNNTGTSPLGVFLYRQLGNEGTYEGASKLYKTVFDGIKN